MDMVSTDMVVDILRHLPPRSLAVSRCVCTAWRATVDQHRLLRADLLPLSLDAVIYTNMERTIWDPMLFCRPSTERSVTTRPDDVDDPGTTNWCPSDCCNGLLLLENNCVFNPATRQSVRLPEFPSPCTMADCTTCSYDMECNKYLVYDPTLSPHYEVFLIAHITYGFPTGHISKHTYHHGPVSAMEMEWPPSPYIIDVFSSKTGCWQERLYIREGDAAGTVADLKIPSYLCDDLYHSAYWHGALYVRCEQGFALRINLSNDRYQVFKLPKGKKGAPRLGKSKKGVYCTLIHGACICEVWFLDESRGKMEWVLRNEINLEPAVTKYSWKHVHDKPWSLQSGDQAKLLLKNKVNIKTIDYNNDELMVDDFEWDSDNENVLDAANWTTEYGPHPHFFECFGFHPYQEIILFHDGRNDVIAYHLNSSKVRFLGDVYHCSTDEIRVSFAYSPCWMRNLPGS